MSLPQVAVTAEQVKQEYDARSAEFGTPEKRDVDQAMADSEDKAKAIIAAVKAGKSLEDAAKEVLGNADGVIKLGPVTKKDLPPGPLADGVFGLPHGVAPDADPVAARLARRAHQQRSRPARSCRSTGQGEAREGAQGQLAPDLLIKLVTDFERIAGQDPVDEGCAEEFSLKVRTFENVDARGQDAVGQAGRDRPGAAELVQAAFATRESARERAAGDAEAASTSSSAPTASRRRASPP